MPNSRRKPKKVDEYIHERAGVQVDIFLTPDNRFEAKLFDTLVIEDSIDKLRATLSGLVRDNLNLKFKPVIAIDVLRLGFGRGEGPSSAHIGIAIRRFYYAEGPKFMYEIRWDDYEEGVSVPVNRASRFFPFTGRDKGDRVFEPPCVFGDTHFLPYDEATWVGAQALVDTIKAAKERLNEILSAGADTLTLVGSGQLHLLGAGE